MLTMKKFNEFKLADQDIVHSTFYDNMHGIIHGSLPLTIYTFFNIIMDYLRLDRKQGHMTCGNWLAIECEESFQNFEASRRSSTWLC